MITLPTTEEGRYKVIKEYILAKLGYPAVNVELSSIQLEMAIDRAVMLYGKNIPYFSYTVTKPIVGAYSVKIEDPEGRHILGLKNVIRRSWNMFLFDSIYGQIIAYSIDVHKLLEVLTYYDIIKKFALVQHEWHWDEGTQSIRFRTKIFQEDDKVLALYYAVPKLTDINISDTDWIINYATAEAKEMLGRIRKKINSVNTTIGTIQLDGDQLLSEAKEEKAKLLEEIQKRIPPDFNPISIW